MPLEPPLSSSAQARLQQLRDQIDSELQDLVADMLALATSERDTAVSEARAESDAALAERLATAQSQAADAQTAGTRAEAEAQAALALAESLAAERAQAATILAEVQAKAAADLAEVRAGERQCDLECMERLLDAVRDLDAAASLSQVLDRLAEHAGAQIARVAVLVVRDGELRRWKTSGFGPDTPDAPAIALRLDVASVVGRAAQSGERATTRDGAGEAASEALAFAPLPDDRVGLAVPLRVGGRTVAVLYADEGMGGEPTVPSAWPEALEILARHAGRCLELQTVTRAYALHAQQGSGGTPGAPAPPVARETLTTGSPGQERPPSRAAAPPSEGAARHEPASRVAPERVPQVSEEDASALRYARLLISEIKLYHEDAVNNGRRDANLLERLGPEIARARRLYEERVPADVRSRADCFGQELVRTLANGDPRLLGQTT
jgi:hypothetical protein